jgi:ComF family protein
MSWLPEARAALRRLLAPDCLVCGVEPGDPVCAGCLDDFLPAHVPRCPGCALRLPWVAPTTTAGIVPSPGRCGRCLVHPRRFDAARALGDYAAPLDAMVAALKFQSRLDLGRAFGELLARRLGGADLPAQAVVPLPLHPSRLRDRGYNQSEEIARALAATAGLPLWRDALQRALARPPQQGLTRRQRRANVRGVFRAPRPLPPVHLLLVDDVLTTGATLESAAAVLKAAGAARVSCLVVARTP